MAALTLGSCKFTSQSVKTVTNRTLQASFGNGYTQIAKDGINSNTDNWTLYTMPLKGTDLTTMDSFFTTVGCDQWFYWTPLGELDQKKFRVVKDSFTKNMLNFTLFTITVKITQCFDNGL